jgi:hypothetical protein
MRKAVALLAALTALLGGCGDYGNEDEGGGPSGKPATTEEQPAGYEYDYP